MLHMSPIYLESAAAVYAEFFEDTLHRTGMGNLGHWLGRGVKPLGLRSPVELKALENLLSGLSPDGGRNLVADAGDPKRIAGWLTVLQAPPRLSSEWGVMTREAQMRVERGFAQGVNRTLRCLEDMVTGVGTLLPRADSLKAVMAVFRTNAAGDQTPGLRTTAIVMNLGLLSPTKALTFNPSQVMAMESGLRDVFARALDGDLDQQVERLKSFANRFHGLDRVLENILGNAGVDALRRSTWARSDDRALQQDKRSEAAGNWRRDADQLTFKSDRKRNMQAMAKPGQLFSALLKKLQDGNHTTGNESPRNSGLQAEETKEVEKQRSPVPPKKSKEELYGHSH